MPYSSRVDANLRNAVLLVLGAALVAWAWSPILADFGGDNAVYWFMANHWSPWGGQTEASAHFAERSIYPPLYPLVLAVTGGGVSVVVAHVVSAVMLALSLVWLYAFGRSLELGSKTALFVVACFVGSNVTLIQALQLHSEHPFILLSMAALTLASASAPSAGRLYLAALCIAAAYLTRTFAIALVVAFVLSMLMQRRKGAVGAICIIAVPIMLWSLASSSGGRYIAALIDLYGDLGIGPRLAINLELAWYKWRECFGEPGLAGFQPIFAGTIAAAALLGALMRAYRFHFDGFYTFATLVLIVIWPYPAEYSRFYFSLLPVLLAQAAYAGSKLRDYLPHPDLQRAALPLLFVIVVATELPFLVLLATRLATIQDDTGSQPFRHHVAWFYRDPGVAFTTVGYQRAVIDALTDIRERSLLPPEDCMRAIKTSIASFYVSRTVRPMPRPAGAQVLSSKLRSGRCQFLFMTLAPSPTFPENFYPFLRLRDELEVVEVYENPADERAPAAILARLKTQ